MKAKTLLISLSVLAALIFIKLKWLSNEATTANKAGGNKPPMSTVSGYVLKPAILDNKLYVSGTVLANEEVELHPESSGKISKLYLKEGRKVSKGELLVKINDADLQAQLKKISLQLKLAEEREKRQKQLLGISGISQEEYDVVLNQLNSLKADMDFTKAQIAKTEIRAPFSGQVGLKWVSEGSYVSPTMKIATVQQLDPVKIDFSIPEKYAGKVNLNDPVLFNIAGNNQQFKGTIYAIEPKIDPGTRTLQIRALCPNKGGHIYPGAFAKIQLLMKETPNALLIPTQAVIPSLKGKKVFVCRGGMAISQMIETGIRTDTQVEVLSGLQIGDTIITSGIMQLKDKAPVKMTSVK